MPHPGFWVPPTDEVPDLWAPSSPIVLGSSDAAIFIVSGHIYSTGTMILIHARLRQTFISTQHQAHVFARIGEFPTCKDESIDFAVTYSGEPGSEYHPSFRLLGANASEQAFDAQIWMFPNQVTGRWSLTLAWPYMHLSSTTFPILFDLEGASRSPKKLWAGPL
jgi:hypothetical protein